MSPVTQAEAHLESLSQALDQLRPATIVIDAWSCELAHRLHAGARLLVAGNGGSAAQAQHLSAELVGRYREERRPYAAIALSSEPSSLTALGNDYGFEAVFARQVVAHGRPGDVFLALSTSGRSANIVAAVAAARRAGLTVWAVTGPGPNPLASAAHEAVTVAADTTATIQEIHLVALHLLCAGFDAHLVSATNDAAASPWEGAGARAESIGAGVADGVGGDAVGNDGVPGAGVGGAGVGGADAGAGVGGAGTVDLRGNRVGAQRWLKVR